MTRWLSPLVSLGLLALPAMAVAQPAPVSETAEALQCAYQRKDHPDYILWVCNPEGTEASLEGSVLWLRRNAAGAEVLTSVWHGSSTEMVKESEAIISRHSRAQARCRTYVYLARAQRRTITWNLAPPSMMSVLKSLTGEPDAGVCYTAEPGAADFIALWAERPDLLPDAFTVDIPATTTRGDVPARQPERTPEPIVDSLSLQLHRVEPGMDNTLLRLGLTVFVVTPDPPAVAAAARSEPPLFARVVRFLAQRRS